MKPKLSYEELLETLRVKSEKLAELEGEIKKSSKENQELDRLREIAATALKSHSDTFFVFDPSSGKTIYWNDTFREVSGYSDEEIGSMKAPDQWYSKEDLEKAGPYITNLGNDGAAKSILINLLTKKGESIPFEYQASIFNYGKNESYIVSIGRDITERRKLEKLQQEQENSYSTLISNLDDIVYRYEYLPEPGFTFVSESVIKILGYTPEEHYADPNFGQVMIHPDDRHLMEQYVAKSLEGNVPFSIKFVSKDGRTVWMEQRNTPVFNDEGELVAVEGISRDITEKVKLEHDLRRAQLNFKDFMNASTDPFTYWKIDGSCPVSANKKSKINSLLGAICLDSNEAASERFGKKRDDILGKTYQGIVSNGDSYPDLEDFVTSNYHIENKETQYTFPDGRTHYALDTWYGVVEDDELKYFWISSKRITAQKEAEIAFQKAKEKAEESDRFKTEFINNMSHEIRTPMNGIMGFTQFLEDESLSAEKKRQYITIINNSGNQLLRIIDDILEISQLETKQVQIQEDEFLLNDFMVELFSVFDLNAKTNKTPLYLKKGLPDNESRIFTDRSKLHKILSNLLENALKYTHTGYIDFGYQRIGDELEIYVKDTGIGIHPDNQELVFKRFSQEDKELSKQYGGLGLGLSIAKENVELLNGKITLSSVKDEGSTFFVRIPYKPIAGEPETLKESESKDPGKKGNDFTVLIVDDDVVNYLYLEAVLMRIGKMKFSFLHAKDGLEAIDHCKLNSAIDLVLMDLKMPEMDGVEATKHILKIRPELNIIAQTAYKNPEDEIKAISAGCVNFITKPIEANALKEMVREYLRGN